MKLILIILSILCFPLSSFGEVLVLETVKGRIFISKIEKWELGKDIFGMPFVYFSPSVNGQRSNISFTYTGVEPEFDLAELGQTQIKYENLKKEWVKSVNGVFKKITPYRSWKNKNSHNVYEIGFLYEHGKKSYIETSYYIKCKSKLLYSKSLRLEVNTPHQEIFNSLIDTLDCSL